MPSRLNGRDDIRFGSRLRQLEGESGSCGCQFLQLAEVIQVVAGHGFDDGFKGHGAALGVCDLLGCGLRRSFA
jgi:hypothetical protein